MLINYILLDKVPFSGFSVYNPETDGVEPLHDPLEITAEYLPAFYNNSTSHSKSIFICFAVNYICIMFVRV